MTRRARRTAAFLCGTIAALAPSLPVAHAAADKPAFASGGSLKICTAGDFPPMQYYRNPGDADLVGFEIDVIDAIAKLWDVKPEFMIGDFKGLLPSLDSGRCDLVASGILITPERLEKYDGVPYFGSNVVLLVPASDETTNSPEALSGQVVAIEAGSAYEKIAADLNEKLSAGGKDAIALQTYPSASGVVEQILVGRAAGTVTQDTTAAFRMMQVPGKLRIAYTFDGRETYGIYMRKSDEDRKNVKDAIEALQASGELKALLAKWSLPTGATDVPHD